MNTQQQSAAARLLEELKRRRVIRVATLYVIVLWPVIQIVDILGPAIDLPPATMRYLLIAFVAGLPLALILSWLYDLNRSGIVRAGEGRESGQALLSRGAEITVIGILLVIIAVLAYLQLTTEAPPAAAPAPPDTPPGVHAIAVLPFVAFSQNPEDELFSDGLTEELLNALAQIRNLRVTARTTSFAYKGVNRNVQEIGKELNVDTILEGSVRRNDVENTIRVTAQLIDASNGTHLWSGSFDKEFRDIFKIQEDITAGVIAQLNLALGADESQRLLARESASPEAMVAYGMGRTALATRTEQSLRDAERYFKQAISADPEYATAYAELANAYSLQADIRPERRETFLRQAQAQVDRALELDADSGTAWAAQGLIHLVHADSDPRWRDDARTALRKAIDLNPSLAMANMWYGSLQEDLETKLAYYETAFELDPRSPAAGYNLASHLLLAGDELRAMEVFSKIVEADPNYPGAYRLIAQINEYRGRLGEAIRNYTKVYEMQPTSDAAEDIAELWVDIGDFEQADQWLARAEAMAGPEDLSGLAWLRIASYVARGDRATAELGMRALLENASSFPTYLNAAQAGYFLGENAAAAAAYENAIATAPEGLHGEMGIEVQLAVAHVYLKLGRQAEAEALLTQAEQALAEQETKSHRLNPEHYFFAAQLDAIRGDSNSALINLQRAVDEGWRQHWRPLVEPSLAELTELPAFEAMMAGLSTRMELIREQIAFSESFDRGWQI